jgi:hypothetical protein
VGLRIGSVGVLIRSRILPTITEPSLPALIAIWQAGTESACAPSLEMIGGTQKRNAATRQDPFFDGRTVHRLINSILALLHLDRSRTADADYRDAPASFARRS